MVSMNLKSHCIGGVLKALILECIARLRDSTSLQEFAKLFRAMCVILLSTKDHEGITNALQILSISTNGPGIEDPTVTNIAEELDEHAFETTEKLTDTPFHTMCARIIEEVKWEIEYTDGENANMRFCPEFLDDIFMKNNYAALIALWTDIFVGVRGTVDKQFTATSAPIEGFFKQKKRTVHDVLPNKVGRYVDIEKKEVASRIKKIELNIRTDGYGTLPEFSPPQSSFLTPKTPTYPILQTKGTASESWKNRPRKKLAYADGHLLKDECRQRILKNQTPSHVQNTSPYQDHVFWKRTPKDAPKLPLSTWTGRIRKRLAEVPIESNTPTKRRLSESVSSENVYFSQKSDSFISKKENLLSNNDEVHSEHSVIVGSSVQPDVMQVILTSHYRVHLPQKNLSEELPLLFKLDVTEHAYITSRYNLDLNGVLLTFGDDKPLYLADMIVLLTRDSMNSTVIDACLHDINKRFGKASVYVGSHTDGSQIFFEDFAPSMAINKTFGGKYRKAFIPVRSSNHWTLVVIDLSSNEIAVLDPSGNNRKEQMEYCRTIEKFFTNLNSTTGVNTVQTKFKVRKRFYYPCQGDDNNCGVFIVQYVESFLRCQKFVSFDPYEYRVELAKRLILSSKETVATSPSQALSRELLNCITYDNGLISNIDFYHYQLPKNAETFVVCNFGQGFVNLHSDDFSSLLSSEWLSSVIIDLGLYAIIKDSAEADNTINVLWKHTGGILQIKLNCDHVLNKILLANKTLILPVNLSGNHWCLAIANFKEKTYVYLDPLALSNQRKHLCDFLAYINLRNSFTTEQIGTDGWTIKKPPHLPTQQDGNNCGVYILYYATQIIRGARAKTTFEPEEFRREIAKKILKACPNMRHLCVKCGKDEFYMADLSVSNMVQCNACLRWYHLKCSRPLITNLEDVYQCFLCKRYLHERT